MFGKKGYVAIILRKENENYVKIGEKSFNNTDKTFSFEKKSFPVMLNVAYYHKGKAILFYDFGEGKENKPKQLSFQELKINVSLDDIDALIEQNIVVRFLGQINKAFEKMEMSGALLKYIVVLGFGILLGYVVGTSA